MAVEIIMPKVDMVMETGTFVEWLKNEGEAVQKGEPLFVILTDKATIEVEAPESGVLANQQAKPDDIIPVSRVIGYLLQPGETKLPMPGIQTANKPSETSKTPAVLPTVEVKITTGGEDQFGVPGSLVMRATPLARRIANQHQVDLHLIQGSGPRGRIYRADVERYLNAALKTAKISPSPEISTPAGSMPAGELHLSLPKAREKQRIPFTGPRRIIAQRMAYSAATIPHIHISMQVDMTEAIRLREKLNPVYEKSSGYRLSYTALLAYSVSHELSRHSFLNSSLVQDELVLWEDVHLGIAIDLEESLIVAVIREAQNKKLEQINTELHQLVEKARTKKLLPAEMTGSTFTLSNLGMLGADHFTAIINPPEAAILAVGKIQEMPASIAGKLTIRPMVNLTLAVDHRIIDGARATRFLSELKSVLEDPYLLI